MESFIGILFIVFGILQIILFFKIWGMTNDISSMKQKKCANEYLIKADMALLKGDKKLAGEFLHEALLYELALLYQHSDTEIGWRNQLERLEKEYRVRYEKIDLEFPDFDPYIQTENYL